MFIGIDPGSSGAIAVLDGGSVQTFVYPKIGTKTDWREYSKLFGYIQGCRMAGLEQVHAINGSSAKATFTFGGYFYSALCLLHANDIPHMLIQPKVWQKEIYSEYDKVYKPGKSRKTLDTKKTSLMACKRLFPGENLFYGGNEKDTGRRSKEHEGIVDALLIAEYVRRKQGIS